MAEKNENVEELMETREHIKQLLESLESEYNTASISEDSYNEIKEKNAKKLEEIEGKIKKLGGNVDGPKPVINGHLSTDEKPESPTEEPNKEPAENKIEDASETQDKPDKKKKKKKKAKSGTLAASVTDVPGYMGSSEDAEEKPEEPSEEQAGEGETPEEDGSPDEAKKPEEAPKVETVQAPPSSIEIEVEKKFNKYSVEMERIKAHVDSVKESRSVIDERLQRLTENIGELRSMIYQKEGQIDQLETKFQRMDELMNVVKPENFTKELSKRDGQISELEARLEKTETRAEEMLKVVKDIQKVLVELGNLDNVIDVSRKTADKVLKVQNLTESAERYSKNVQKIYVDLSKGLEEIERIKANQERLDGAIKELSSSSDVLSNKFEKYTTVDDFKEMRESSASISREIDNLKNFISSRLPILETISEPLKKLKEEKEEVETLLKSLDEKYSEGKIDEDEYRKIKEANEKKIAELDKGIKKEWKRIERTKKRVNAPIPDVVKPPKDEPKKITKNEEPLSKPEIEVPKKETKKEEKVEEKKKEPKEKPKEEKVEEKPSETKEVDDKKKEKPDTKGGNMMSELEDLFNKGLISGTAYEKTKERLLQRV